MQNINTFINELTKKKKNENTTSMLINLFNEIDILKYF